MMSDEKQVVHLTCTVDGHSQRVPLAIAQRIGIIKPLLAMKSDLNLPLPINEVRGPLLAKIVEYLEAHQQDPIRREASRKNPEQGAVSLAQGSDSDEDDNYEAETRQDVYENDDLYYERYAEVTSPWDQRFMDSFDTSTLIELTKAANYLYIADLLDLCCKTIAGQMVGLSVEELRKKFNIKNDFTPEEEAKLAAEFAWVEE